MKQNKIKWNCNVIPFISIWPSNWPTIGWPSLTIKTGQFSNPNSSTKLSYKAQKHAHTHTCTDIFLFKLKKTFSEQLSKRLIYYFISSSSLCSFFFSLDYIEMRNDAWKKVWKMIGIFHFRMHTHTQTQAHFSKTSFSLVFLSSYIQRERSSEKELATK